MHFRITIYYSIKSMMKSLKIQNFDFAPGTEIFEAQCPADTGQNG